MIFPIVFIADFVVAPLIGLVFALRFSPVRGLLLGLVPLLVCVLILFLIQVSPGPTGPGRFGLALSYMLDETVAWLPAYMVGAAIGAVLYRRRAPRG